MELDIAFAGTWPASPGAIEIAERCAKCVTEAAVELANPLLVTTILFTDDEQVHALNREWRERDKPTNVLSFPMLAREDLLALASDGPPVMLGDIALAYETCAREAEEKGISLDRHTAHLIVHGLLHLAGYDHEISEEDAEQMEALETRTLAKMGLPDPYGERDVKE